MLKKKSTQAVHFLLLVILLLSNNQSLANIVECKNSTSCVQQISENKIYQKDLWIKLIHYKKNIIGNWVSYQDSTDFFLSDDGKYSPEKELIETFKSLTGKKKISLRGFSWHPQCFFPARYKFLKENIKYNYKDEYCGDFSNWKKRLNAKGVALIFSTAFISNPASMFGHSFLRILSSDKKNQKHKDLLEYAVSFSADVPPGENGVLHLFKGLFGTYLANFSIAPYYMKVGEYNNIEGRDLWEYSLNFNSKEIDRFIDHLWELFSLAKFDYYFFDENCSFHLLGLLEVARPSLSLTNQFSYFVAPNETIRAVLSEEDLLKDVNIRHSLFSKLLTNYQAMSNSEKKLLKGIIDGKVNPLEISNSTVIDQAVNYLNYKKHNQEGAMSPQQSNIFRNALIARSKIRTKIKEVKLADKDNRPDLGHSISQFRLLYGRYKNNNISSFSFRPGFHDFMNSDLGYENFSQIYGFDSEIAYNLDLKKLTLDRFTIISLKNITPYNSLTRPLSWGIEVKYDKIDDFTCLDCHNLEKDFLIGYSFKATDNSIIVFQGLLHSSYSDNLKNNFRNTFGPKINYLNKFGNIGKLRLTGSYNLHLYDRNEYYDFYKFDSEISLFTSKNSQFNIKLNKTIQVSSQNSFTEINFSSTTFY